MKRLITPMVGMMFLAACSFGDSDQDGDGKVDAAERKKAMENSDFTDMKPGLWETKLQIKDIDIPNINAAQKQEMIQEFDKQGSNRSCLSAEDAKKPEAKFFSAGAQDCTYEKFDISGGNADMKLTCNMKGMGEVKMDLTGKVGEEAYNFDADMSIALPVVGTIKMQGRVDSKYVGACPK